MDSRSFDRLAVAMASGASRRRVVAGLAAGFGVGVAGTASAAKGGNGKGNGNGNGDHGNSGNAPGHDKVGVCHATGSSENPYVFLRLPKKAAEKHAEKHGDAINVDLDTDVDNCGKCGNVCDTPTDRCLVASCDEGACGTVPLDCDDANECTTDTCNSLTGCVHTPVADGTPCTGGTCTGGVCGA